MILMPGQLGAAYFLPTVIVPFLLITHVLMFCILVGQTSTARARGGIVTT
jgi:hypothetical protein